MRSWTLPWIAKTYFGFNTPQLLKMVCDGTLQKLPTKLIKHLSFFPINVESFGNMCR